MQIKNISKRSSKELHDYKIAFQDLEHKVEIMFQRLWKNPFNHESPPDLFSQYSLMDIPKMDIVDREKEVLIKVELSDIDKKTLISLLFRLTYCAIIKQLFNVNNQV